MKRLRRIVFSLALVACFVSVILLLNFTAPNPTGRRYSSRMPLSTRQGSANQIGLDGERVLSDDLRLPRNDAPDQLQCLCNKPGYSDPANCRVCIVSVQLTAAYRRPDFVAPAFIAESKNAQNLYYDSRDLQQITDFAMAARALKRPLWVYTRVNTNLDSEFYRIVESTGGGVVPYFTVAGYVDPMDTAASRVAFGSGIAIIVLGLWEFAARRVATPRVPSQPKSRTTQLDRAIDSVETSAKFTKESKERHRDKLD
ncbi:MAG: hypothetical protein ABI947_27420 [Chloroflexota bacterium]